MDFIRYARVPTREEKPDGQTAALAALSQGIDTTAHCSRPFSHVLAATAECDNNSYTLQQIAESVGVSRGTIYRFLGDSVSRH
jgi:response regulator of citrate/malate metabolism